MEELGTSPASEAEVNTAAAAEIAASEQAAQSDVSKPVVADSTTAQKTDPQKAAPVEPAFDAQKSYAALQKQYAETQKWATQQAQMRAQFEKELSTIKQQHAEVAKKLAEATEEPFNLEQFNKDFVARGFKAFDPYLEKKLSSVREQYEPKLQEQAAVIEQLRTEVKLTQCRTDSRNYPNFSDMEDKMAAILQSPNCPIDKNLPLDQKIEALYNLAKNQNSEEAVKAAQKNGYEKAQAELAKEAKTAVATGGKGVSTSPADLRSMPLDKLEKLVIQMHGIADRD